MAFTSASFIVLTIASVLLYYIVPKKAQWCILLLASAAFYMAGSVKAFAWVVLVAGMTWVTGLILGRYNAIKPADKAQKAQIQHKKKQIAVICAVCCFGLLYAMKYWNFTLELLPSALGNHIPRWDFVVPLGLSFFIFQSMSYVIDVYRGKYAPERNPLRYGLFVSFFPQMVQGPISRFDQLAPQLTAERKLCWDDLQIGIQLALWGYFKKIVIADRAAVLVNNVIMENCPYGGAVIALGILFYCIQLYCDFSGGIDMVLGVAQLFGIEMMPNFRQPYFSTSLGDFWRRWHISLGAWMRDYLFYPFALTKPMQRFGKWATGHWGKHFGRVLPAAVANLLVFAVVGIWHGPQAHYLVWGLYNGMVIALADLLEPAFKKMNTALHIPTESRTWHIFRILRTFIIVNIGWYFDRVGLSLGAAYLRNTFVSFRPEALTAEAPAAFAAVTGPAWGIVAISTVLVFVHSLLAELGREPYTEVQRLPLALRWGLYYLVMFLVTLSFICVTETSGFLYANF